MSETKTIEKFLFESNRLAKEVEQLKKFEIDFEIISNSLQTSDLLGLYLINNSPIYTIIVDNSFNIKYLSKSCLKKLNLKGIESYFGKPLHESFFNEPFASEFKNSLKLAKTSEKPTSFEGLIIDSDNNSFLFQSIIIPIRNTQNKDTDFLIFSIDISDEKGFEESILKSRSFNESILKTTPDIIYVYDLIHLKNIYSNNRNLKHLGYSMKDIYDFDNKLLNKIMHPEDFKVYKNDILKKYEAAKDEEIIEFIFRAKHKNGSWRWLHSRESVFKRTKNGKVQQIIGVVGDITNQKIAEEKNKKLLVELEESKRYLKLALEGSGLGIWDWWLNDNTVKFDSRWAEMLGLDINNISMDLSTWENRIHPDDIDKCYEDINKYLKGETNFYENIHRMKHADGHWVYILDRGRISEYNEDGSPKRFTGTHADITESVLNQKTKLDELNRVISSSPSCLKIISREGILIDMNQRGLDILSCDDLNKIKGKSVYDFVDEHYKNDFIAFNERICRGESGKLKYIILDAKGEKVWVESFSRPYKLANGEVAHIAITNDITDRISKEKRLKENQELLKITGEIANIGGWELDLVNEKLIWSDVTKRVHEVQDNYIPELSTAINFYHPDDRDLVRKSVENAITKGEKYDIIARIITAKGNEKHVRSQGVPVFEKGNCIRLYGAFQDITEHRRVEIKLEQYRTQLETENVLLKKEISLDINHEEMVFSSLEMSKVLNSVQQVAVTDATVLILGETGTGKELIAKAIHKNSPRKDSSFIRVNCGAIPAELIESELFGHIKGSFTGAISNRIGKFELADGGTLFLDEIGELPMALQPKLLRAIQEGEIEPIGSSKLKKLDVRIIAATNRDLKQDILENRFREDLYFRLNVFPINVPALRNRIDDISVLTNYFVDKYCKKHNKEIKYIADSSLQEMKLYEWPGNVRELENIIERAVILSNDDILTLDNFGNTNSKKTNIIDNNLTLDEVQKNHILKTLINTNWKIDGKQGAAELLNVKPSTLRDRMKKFGIHRPK